MQRKGRTGHAQFRVIVQDSRFHPTSGRVVAYVGNYDPHTKVATLDGEKISQYLSNGAQPSDRVAKLLTKEGIKLPDWFQASVPKSKAVRNADKRRSTRPAGAPEPSPAQTSSDEVSAGKAKTEEAAKTPAEAAKEAETTEASVESAETPAVEEIPAADSSTEALAKAEEPAAEPEALAEPAPESAEKPAQ